ncbi:MAG: putative peptidoglycan bound protein, partial [Arthrobacter sp.]|nr:putative peptidoglycan bound protein [Arthrobacter sp.]
MSTEQELTPLSEDELMAEAGTALPDKEVASVLDLNADLDLGINAAAPIDLAVAANANVAAPIDAAASANILSFGSESQALADQGVIINQGIEADATAESAQDSTIDQATG